MKYRTPILLTVLVLAFLFSAGVASSSTIPTVSIVSVVRDQTVTFRTYNYPPNQTFTVTMGPMGTMGIGGIVAGAFNSGAGGSFTKTFAIPAELRGSYQVSIRAQTAHVYPYYSYNWFYNNSTTAAANTTPATQPTTQPATSVYTGIPTFKICAVNRDQSVTILTNNYPKNQTFTVTMGFMGTLGIGGTVVATFDSGDGGAFTRTFDIPANLHGLYQISIRAQTAHANPYYSYNWFYNNTASVCN